MERSGKPIVGVGEVLWDIFPDGRKAAGGAPFNFAFHCHQFGHPGTIVSRVGDDELGRELRARVRELGLSDAEIQTDPERPTGTVLVTVDAGGQPSYAIDMAAAWGRLEWTPGLDELTKQAAAVCHGTLALEGGQGSRAVIHELAHEVRKNGGLTIYDVNLRARCCEHADEMALSGSDWIKMNEDEQETLASRISRGKHSLLIVTRGAAGVEAFTPDMRYEERPPPVKVVDTVGAGDAFTAALVCLSLEGRSLPDCLRFACYYAARVCQHQGATPQIDRADVEREAFGAAG